MDISPLFLLSVPPSLVLGALALWVWQQIKLNHFKKIAADIIQRAELESETVKRNGELAVKHLQINAQREQEKRFENEMRKLQREEERLTHREDNLEGRMSLLEKKLSSVERRESELEERKREIETERNAILLERQKLIHELEVTAGMTESEAKTFLIQQVVGEVKQETANYIRKRKKEAEEEADRLACRIIATAINRMSVPCVPEATVNTVAIPNEEMKGRIIGREGRNIRALEQATGVTIVIDDTPGAVVLSCFDPIRMQIAKLALKDLVQDGRIHPTRIEEAVEKGKQSLDKMIKQYGEDAALRAGAFNLHPELIQLLGKLKFRYSLGQNILDHSLEVSHLMGIMAAELGLDSRLARRIGLLHDVGKALSHEVEGTHAIIGHDFALRWGETREVANGIGCHHQEMEPITVEGSLCGAADAISASRQGARSEPVEEYVKRLRQLENLALEFQGVEKAYVMQAGREVRVVVEPDRLNDQEVQHLARDLSRRIESELKYPGKIKVTVVRERRVVEYAI